MKSSFFQRQKKQSGFLSIEAIVVLVVVLGLLALGASKMDILTGNSNATEELSNIQTFYAATKGLKTSAGYGAAGTDLIATHIANASVPKNVTVTGGKAYNLYGGEIQVKSTGTGFSIAELALPSDACVKLALKVSGGGTFTSTTFNGGTAQTGPLSSAAATTGCNSATNSNTVLFTTAS